MTLEASLCLTLVACFATPATFFSCVRYVKLSQAQEKVAAAKRTAQNREHFTPKGAPGATSQLVGIGISDSRLVLSCSSLPSTAQISMLHVNVEHVAVTARVHVLGVDMLDPMAEKWLTKIARVTPSRCGRGGGQRVEVRLPAACPCSACMLNYAALKSVFV